MEHPRDALRPGRLTVLGLTAVALVAVLALRLWQLQIVQGERFARLADENRLRILPQAAPRGVIYDRKGRPLATSRPSFTVAILPMELADPARVLPRLARIVGARVEEIEAKLTAGRARPYEPVRIARDASPRVVAVIEENRLDLPGVIIQSEPVRAYLGVAAHALGYVGEISERELAGLRDAGRRAGDLIGKTGIERTYDAVLRGRDGQVQVEADARGRPLRELAAIPAVPGRSIVLGLDLDLQRVAEAQLAGKRGAVVALDPRTGEVLAYASSPAYDPNVFTGGISAREWTRLTTDPAKPLLDRAGGAAYEPGSVFKVVTAAAALEAGVATRTTVVNCTGAFRLGGWVFRDLGVYGPLQTVEAIARSCNVFFYTMGYRLGGERLEAMGRALGFGERTGIDLPSEEPGRMAGPEWKRRTYGQPWYPGDSVNLSIGQGAVGITPLQAARMLAAVATGGRVFEPHLLHAIRGADGRAESVTPPRVLRTVPFHGEALAVLHEGLEAVVSRGTGRAAQIEGLRIAGKTGSAENPRGKPHAWFVAYAPADAPRIVVAVFIEHGFRGGIASAPIARALLQTYLGPGPAAVVPR